MRTSGVCVFARATSFVDVETAGWSGPEWGRSEWTFAPVASAAVQPGYTRGTDAGEKPRDRSQLEFRPRL